MNLFRVGTEEEVEEVLVTRIARKPPRYRLEYPGADGKTYAAMMIKAKNSQGYDVLLDDNMEGFRAPTRKAAVIAFREMVELVPVGQPSSEEGPVL